MVQYCGTHTMGVAKPKGDANPYPFATAQQCFGQLVPEGTRGLAPSFDTLTLLLTLLSDYMSTNLPM